MDTEKSSLFSFFSFPNELFSNAFGHYRSVTANCDAEFSFLFFLSLIISLVRIKHLLLKKKKKKKEEGKSTKEASYL